MKILEFSPKYTREIYDFVMSVKAHEIGWTSEPEELWNIESFYTGGGGNFWIAITDDKIVGSLALKNMGSGRGYLKRMFLAREHRGTGLAQEMMQILLDHAKDQNILEIYLETGSGEKSKRAVAFFEKSGFKRVDSLPADFISDGADVYMKLEL